METITAYKILENDYTCKGFKYEIGQAYEMCESPVLCERGFHACYYIQKCFEYYPCVQWNKYVEVLLFGKIVGDKKDKFCSNKIKIIRELPFHEMLEIVKNQSGINNGRGINNGAGINYGFGINNGRGINNGAGINDGRGINYGSGINNGFGINNSFGILNCHGVSNELFNCNKKETYKIFNKKVSKGRFEEIKNKLYSLLNGWYPQSNNLYKLKGMNTWEETPIPKAQGYDKLDWVSMPSEAIEYIKGLPEYNAKMFKTITGLK